MANLVLGILIGIFGKYLFYFTVGMLLMNGKEWKRKERKKKMWEKNAHIIETVFGGYVDWDERFYLCPECGEPIYETDWCIEDLMVYLCPICEFEGEVF